MILVYPFLQKMQRLILTFPTLHAVLAAEKAVRTAPQGFQCRVTPTPAGLGYSICGMSLEILSLEEESAVVDFLRLNRVPPEGIHRV
jgi:hypothetical protein